VPAVSPAAELFEKEIRPLLLAECGACHGARRQEGGLRLDERSGAMKGGSKGAALTPGHPERSLLLQAIRHEGLKMPPGKRLPEAKIALLETWIRAGAPWPQSPKTVVTKAPHWSFQRLRRPAVPAVPTTKVSSRNPIDAFVLARLKKAGLSPSPPTDRGTLIRRVTYDLIGLPPSPEEVDAFVSDTSPDAYEKVVDRLLASPAYGERWGRHWLDVARYADTKDGVLMYGDARIRPFAYTYRDYVVRALNEDTPYNRFLQEQLAADLIQPPVEPWRLAGMGFLTLGRQFDNNAHDVIDDRIDTVTRGMLGLTVACARCHDHKYDPIPTADYYSLYGVFASADVPFELPLIEKPENTPAYAEFEKQSTPKKRKLEEMTETQHRLLTETARQRVGDYLAHVATTEPDALETAIYFLSLSPEELRPQIVARWRKLLERRAQPDDAVFGPWQALMALPPASLSEKAPGVIAGWKTRAAGVAKGQINPLVLEALSAAKLTDRAAVARAYGDLLVRVYTESQKPGSGPLSAPERKQLLDLVVGPDSPGYFPKSQVWFYLNRPEKDAYGGLQNELDLIAVRSPGTPARAMVVNDLQDRYDPRIFVRGNPSQPGDAVPRRFLKVLSGDTRQPFQNGSGRLDLAKAITDPTNPLTARVIVNRVWMHHFGEPLVGTPSDFGTRSNPPTHPELLDWLSATFVAKGSEFGVQGSVGNQGPASGGLGWSLKRLHRLLVTSQTYRQSSVDRQACREKDPENKLLWRANRRRLDFEQVRDTLLAVSGRLDRAMGGRPLENAVAISNRRRTIYALVDRQSLPEVFRSFNFPQPDQSVERRPNTTVPQQALFGLNSPFVMEQARALIARPEVTAAASPEAKVAAIHRVLFARSPTAQEVLAGQEFIRDASSAAGSKLGAWEQYAQVLLLTNEMIFVD